MARVIEGVSVIYKATKTGRILTVKEKCSKPEIKRKGQLSLPAETTYADETNLEALKRVFEEEIGIPFHDQCDLRYLGRVTWVNNEIVCAEVDIANKRNDKHITLKYLFFIFDMFYINKVLFDKITKDMILEHL